MPNITLSINQQSYTLTDLDARTSLLDVCRHHLNLTGSKKGCDHGQCGACTMIVNGRRINSCLSLAIMHEGDEITTIEGIGEPSSLSDIQQAFVDNDAFQCGYCTPGQICSATALFDEIEQRWPSHVSTNLTNPELVDVQEIAERMSGNICRCSAYPNIIKAIQQVMDSRGLSNTLASQGDTEIVANTGAAVNTTAQIDKSTPQIWSPPPSNIHHPAAQNSNSSSNNNPNNTAPSSVGDAQ